MFALGNQVNIADGMGRTIAYVKQKVFTMRDDITIFTDDSASRPLYRIKADRVIDFSARFHFTDPDGRPIGSMKRHGMRSIWRAHYDVFDASGSESPVFSITEANPWLKVADHLLTEIPIVGLFHNYLIIPSYVLKRGGETGSTVLRLIKRPSLVGRRFAIERELQGVKD